MKRLPAVEVIWEDSQSSDAGWLMKDKDLTAWEKGPALVIRTVGLLKRKTKDRLIVIQCDSRGQVLHGVKIPRRCVLSIRRLK